jgi:hypothetical protein
LFSNLTSIEGKGVLYSCDEKKEHSKSRVWFEDIVLKKFLSKELSSIWNNLNWDKEKEDFHKIVDKYATKLNWKYNYNIIWNRILLELNSKWLEKDFVQKTLDITLSTKCDIKELWSSIWNSWGELKSSAIDFIETGFNDLDELALNIKNANNKDRLKLLIDTTAQSAYEGIEPSKRLKFLSLFLPKTFITFISNSASQFIVKWKTINTSTFIDDIMWYIDNIEWVVEFFEIDTKKHAKLDVKNLNFEILS